MNKHSNDQLARLLNTSNPNQRSASPDPTTSRGRPQDLRAQVELGKQQWTFGGPRPSLAPLTEPEVRRLFAALSRGTKATLGREPTVQELLRLKDEVNRARDFLASVDAALEGKVEVYFGDGNPVFIDAGRAGGRPNSGSQAA